MLKVNAPYSTTAEPKSARARAQTISPMRGNRVRLLDSTNITSQSSWMHWIQIFMRNA